MAYIGKNVGTKSRAPMMIHITEILLLTSTYLMDFWLHSSFLKCLVPMTKKSDVNIITKIFIANNRLSILASQILYYSIVDFIIFLLRSLVLPILFRFYVPIN